MADKIRFLGDSILVARKRREMERHERFTNARDIEQIAQKRFAIECSEIIEELQELLSPSRATLSMVTAMQKENWLQQHVRYAAEALDAWRKCSDAIEQVLQQNEEEAQAEVEPTPGAGEVQT